MATHALTGLQQGMLFEALGEPGGGVDVMQLVISLPEAVDARALEQAWQEITRRHAVLRSAFAWGEGDEAAQLVHRRVELPLHEIDLRPLDGALQRAAMEGFLERDREAGFDLARPPLMRLCLLHCGEALHELVWTFHHILLDGRSFPQLLAEVFAAYEALRSGQAPAPAPVRPYADFAAWLSAQSPSDSESFWRAALRGFVAPTPLPWAGPARAAGPRRGQLELRLTESETRTLLDATAHQGLSPATLVQGAWALLLARHGREAEVVFGATRAGRPFELAGSRTMVGLFINTLPLRVAVTDDEAVGTWLARLEAQQRGQRSHEHTPLWRVKQWSEVPAAGPLFESVVMVEKYELEEVLQALGGAWARRSVRLIERPAGALLLGVYCGATRMRLQLWWDGQRLSGETAERLLGQLRTLMLGMAGDLDQPLWRVPLLTAAERHAIVVEWNQTEVEAPETTLHALFEAQVERTPDAVAVVFEHQELTYRQLDERADQLAHHLQSLGVGPDVLVGICVERSLEMVVGLLGILKAGGAYVPLDPSHPAERLVFMLEDACVPVLLTQERLAARLPRTRARVMCLDGDGHDWKDLPRSWPVLEATADSLAYVIFTSGSTGRPKGVMNTHRAATNLLRDALRRDMFPPGARCSAWTSIGFDVSVYEIFGPLAAGCELWIVSDRRREDGPGFLDWLIDSGIHSAYVPAFLLGEWAARLGEAAPGCAMRRMLVGVEPIRESLLHGLLRAVPGLRIVNGYGPTEAAVCSTVYAVSEAADGERNAPIGRPLMNTRAYVLDGHGLPVPIGVAGELHLGGVQVARGYLNRPELTREKFLPDPFCATPGSRLYRTGDLCRYLPDGNLEFLGRLDQQVKLRGFRIELGEIEAVLGQCRGVKQCIVLVREDRPGDKVLVAYVVGAATVGELRAQLGQKLPEYMVPSAFVGLEALPLTPNGKLDRKALPAPTDSRVVQSGAAPRSPLEELVANAFMQVLGLAAVGSHDDFFQLGGHSLKAMQLVSRLRTLAGAELPVRVVFDAPTVAGLARSLESVRSGSARVLPALRGQARAEESPLSYAQQRLWFLEQWQPGSATYNISAAWRLRGALDVSALERALAVMVARHDALRTVYHSVGGEPVQRVLPVAPGLLSVVDLQALPTAAREAAMMARVEQDAGRPFDLASRPVLRASILLLGEQDHVLVYCVHHIAFDGWSHGVFLRELSGCYAAACEGREAGLPGQTVRYADYARWQRGWLEGDVLEAQVDAWRAALAGYPHVLELPLDRARPLHQTHRGGVQTVLLPMAVSVAVQALAQREGLTVFMVLLGAFQALLHRYTGQEQLLVGTPVAGRRHEDLEGLIGCFVNTLVMKADFTDAPSFREHLGRVRATALEAYAHQDLPFEKLVEVLGVARDPSRSPLFQVMFAMEEEEGPAALGALAMTRLEAERHTAKVDLGLSMAPTRRGLVASLEYNADLFDAETATRMLGHLGVLLADAVARPETPVGRLALLTEAERQQIVVEWNQTEVDYPETTIHALFEAQVERTPDAVAVVFEAQQLSYRALDMRANQLAHHLQSLGVGPDVLVGLYVERSLEMVVGLLGILKAGGAYVPLDPTYPKERIEFMLEDTGARVLLTQERLIATLPEHRARVFALDAGWEHLPGEHVDTPASDVEPTHLAYVIYTSGSTGRPKGVLVEHRGVCNLARAQAQAFGVQEGDRVLQFASFSFDAAVSEVFMALTAGGTLWLARRGALLPGPDLAGLLREHAITVVTLPPTALTLLSEEQLPALQGLIVAGEPCPADLVARWAEGRRFFNAYGPTETTVCATLQECRGDGGPPPIGRPIANTRVYVLDPHGQPVPVGISGELYIGGVQVAREYLGRPELTREKFVADPFSATPGARLYRTGDLCRYLPDGNIEFLGRMDHQVKLRGFRIELGEIEAALGQCVGVKQCIVVVRERRPGDMVLVAYVVCEPMLAIRELRAQLAEKLPEYMVPSAFVSLDALPLTPNGKVDRKALPAPGARHAEQPTFVAPRTQIEALLVEIWEHLLQTRPIGIHDDFFHLGGHSLLAVRLMAAILDRTGRQLPLASLFSARTVAAMAAELSVTPGGAIDSPLVALRRTGSRSAFFCVHAIGGEVLCYEPLARALGPERPFYGLQARTVEPGDEAQQTVEEMAERYLEALRVVQPEGPYLLGGWSFGGLVAFEMARQLTAAGEAVATLVLLDSHVPGAAASGDAMAGFEAGMAAELGLALTAEELAPLGPVAALARVVEVAEEMGTLPRGRGAALVQRIRATRQAAMLASRRYTPGSLRGSLTLLRARADGDTLDPAVAVAWARLCSAPIAVHAVPGTHDSMVRAPHVEALARVLQRVLDAADERSVAAACPCSRRGTRQQLEARSAGRRRGRGRTG